MILLDTNALLWVQAGHPRARDLVRSGHPLYVSPVSLLEVALLIEVGKVRLRPRATLADLSNDDRWLVDDPPTRRLFEEALDYRWTRDPFDRLLAAHATLRQWRLATGDDALIEQLGPLACLEI